MAEPTAHLPEYHYSPQELRRSYKDKQEDTDEVRKQNAEVYRKIQSEDHVDEVDVDRIDSKMFMERSPWIQTYRIFSELGGIHRAFGGRATNIEPILNLPTNIVLLQKERESGQMEMADFLRSLEPLLYPQPMNTPEVTELGPAPSEQEIHRMSLSPGKDTFEDAFENLAFSDQSWTYNLGLPNPMSECSWNKNSSMSPPPCLPSLTTARDVRLNNDGNQDQGHRTSGSSQMIDSSHEISPLESVEPYDLKHAYSIEWNFMAEVYDKDLRQRQNSRVRHRISKSVARSVRSSKSCSTYYSAISGSGSMKSMQRYRLQRENAYTKLLQSKKLWPVDPSIEKDWSSRGQHVEFMMHEKRLVDKILVQQDILGNTSTAVVQSVKCKRILLARKTIRCSRTFTKEKAIDEVAHLNRLSHSHVVQVIGTYLMGAQLSILMYPVAEYNLESFIYDLDPRLHQEGEWLKRIYSLLSFYGCLAHAVKYIHSKMTKHMDIKPTNILIRDMRPSTQYMGNAFKIYIADFGIARSYETLDDCETEGPTMFTRRYAAPEVVDRDKRGLSADIFSLGCVFIEMDAAYTHFCSPRGNGTPQYTASRMDAAGECNPLQKVQEALHSDELGDTSYQANVGAVCATVQRNREPECPFRIKLKPLLSRIPQMLSDDPLRRPSASALVSTFSVFNFCCQSGTDPLEATRVQSALEEESASEMLERGNA